MKKLLKKLRELSRGKLTYSSVGALALAAIGAQLGVEIGPTEVDVLLTGGLAITAIFGRWRATRN